MELAWNPSPLFFLTLTPGLHSTLRGGCFTTPYPVPHEIIAMDGCGILRRIRPNTRSPGGRSVAWTSWRRGVHVSPPTTRCPYFTPCRLKSLEELKSLCRLKSRSTTLCPWQRSASWVVNTKARGDTTAALAGIHPSPGGSPLTQVQKLQRMASSGRALL